MATTTKAKATSAKKSSARTDAPKTEVRARSTTKPAPTTRTRATHAATSHAASTARAASDASEVGARVRMYRVGFGDFFLVTFGAGTSSEAHVLIDCGVHSGTTGKGDIGTIQSAVADMAELTGKKLALVVMTHRHADHISGFARCRDVFETFEVGAVWMSAWENEYDGTAKKFQAELASQATALLGHLAARDDADGVSMRDMMWNATGLTASASSSSAARGGSNAAAIDLLKNGLKVTPDYFAAGDSPEVPAPLAKLGVTVRVLGPPPVDDLSLMKLMDLKKGVGEYLDAATDEASDAPFLPFGDRWTAKPDAYPPRAFEEWSRGASKAPPAERMQKALTSAQPSVLLTATKTLDSFLNNQSLVLLFAYRGKQLLFVGDAQAGNWEHWLYGSDAPDKDGTAAIAKDGASILASIDFYKVGHHGSTNATPKVAAAAMREGIVAMCSTQPGVYGTASKGTEVPRTPLLEDLEKTRTLVRSDQLAIDQGSLHVPRGDGAPDALGTPSAGRLVASAYAIDYFF